ncbi:hypothetical protein ACQP00_37795 [Dactylosporangium sp. CS-047395]|uniref:hypothetical protein n=1 Tax=Dactylosporangium sp. CS-047395 TaxID=3239936 RepID=UPI003D94659C
MDGWVVHMEVHDRRGLRGALRARAGELAQRLHFRVTDEPPAPDGGTDRRLLFVVWDDVLDPAVLRRVADGIGVAYDRATIAFAYPTPEASAAAVPHIDEAKTATRDRLNIIRPDRDTAGATHVSDFKLLETMVADSVRVKYRPHRVESRVPDAVRRDVLPFFKAAAARFTKNRMWHRGPYDGCLALRHADGIVVTATRTRKAPLEDERILLVHSYDEATNTLRFSGPALPSADSVELMVLRQHLPDMRAFMHTHARELITDNPRLPTGVRLSARPYGEPSVGHEFADLMRDRDHQLVVIEGHGEFFAASFDGERYFHWIDDVVDRARRSLVA